MSEFKIVPKNKEISLSPNEKMYSLTSKNGIIIDCNEYFQEITGWTDDEIIGKSHKVMRHPDMPKAIFKYIWTRIHNENSFFAVIKNLSKNGYYFWAMTYFEPIYKKNKLIGYQAFRKPISDDSKNKVSAIYDKLWEIEDETENENVSLEFFMNYLEQKQLSYDDWVKKMINEKTLFNLFNVASKFK